MDTLSEILALLKPRSYITAGFDAGGDWCLRLDDLKGRVKCYAVVEGVCWLSPEEGADPIELTAGDSFILPSGRAVTIGSAPGLAPTLVSEALAPDRSGETVVHNGGGDVLLGGSRFEAGGLHATKLLETLPTILLLRGAADQAALRWTIRQMMDELRRGRPGADAMAQNLASMMLVQTLRLYLEGEDDGAVSWLAAMGDPGLARALNALHGDPARRWTLEALGAEAGMSRTVFARRFREKTGETPLAYLTRWRMTLAAEQLNAGATVAQAAEAVGYGSETAFGTTFRRVTGLSPRRYALTRTAG